MPIHKVKGGWKWGSRGKVYKSRLGAERQARAAYANGYRGDRADAPKMPPFAVAVPDEGASCATCKYLRDGVCTNVFYIKWNHGSGELHRAPDNWCCSAWTD